MDRVTILTNAIILLTKERNEKTLEQARKLLASINDNKVKVYTGESDIYTTLQNILDKLIQKEVEDTDAFYDDLKLTLSNRRDILDLIEKYRNISEDKQSTVVKYLKNNISEFIKRTEIIKTLQINLYKFKTETSISEIDKNLADMLERFKKLVTLQASTDDAMIEEIDLELDDDTILNVIKRIKDRRKEEHIFKTGWECLNRTTQGGFRRGEFVTIAGLQHNYKTGFTLSTFTQLVTLNKPVIKDKTKKPLAILFSLEDNNENVFEFIYRYLMITNKNEVIKNLDELDEHEMKTYIKNELTKTGFSVKILRMDPNYITYKKLQNKIESYELAGYDVQIVFVDYLSQIQKDGLAQGPAGAELKDLFKKFRNYANKKSILFVTPHQISTDANQLLRNGIPPIEFVKHIANKNYYDGSRRLAQEIDLELYVHIASLNKKPVLTVQRGKHRIPSTIDDNEKFFMLSFSKKNTPIPGDSENKTSCIKQEDDDIDLDI